MKTLCLGGKKGRCQVDTDPRVKAHTEMLRERCTLTRALPPRKHLALLAFARAALGSVQVLYTRGICLLLCLFAGRKGSLEGPSISHGAPRASPRGP